MFSCQNVTFKVTLLQYMLFDNNTPLTVIFYSVLVKQQSIQVIIHNVSAFIITSRS